ncbi:MAG: C4-dicarboxylate transporter [Candidatus Eremiobacteraeota bacterium]|jgi:tellurite resistance protein|nr:C4-dicarboxylate transporter [Candidatus Eremiobacteraeota bacterium]
MTELFARRSVPTASFASVMGIAGLGLAWREAATAQGLPAGIGEWIIAVSAVIFVALLVVWAARARANPQEIEAEQHSAITASYLGTITISCSLLAAGALPYSRVLATVLWAIGAFGGAALLIYLLGRWIEGGIKAAELTPALFIPVVGNATSVYAAVPLGYGELGWASFAFALLCWLTLGPLTMYRLMVTEPRLPRKMAPQLAVMVSSPAVMASAWYLLAGSADPAFKILAFKALFFALLTARLWKMAWGEPFSAAMWGYTFPTAALAGAFERAAASSPSALYAALATATLAVATIIVVLCAAWTVRGWIRQFTPSAALPAT